MLKIKRADTVQVIKGKDRGKKGKVLMLLPEERRAIVEGINLIKKHKRKTKQDEPGGIISIESPISISNLAQLCKSCARAVRVGFTLLKDNTKVRVCKKCKAVI